jgi:diguanylate cyclase (GGDEF)-like protein
LSTCGWVVADTVYGVQATAGTYVSGSIVDLGWIGGEDQPTLSLRRLALLAAASLLAPVVLIVKSWRGDVDNLVVIGAAAAAMFVLVVLRLAGLASALGAAALRDPLTQLPNRTSFMARLERALQQIDRAAPHVAVLFIDIDRFKLLNDTMGHNAGDAVLLTVARRLEREVRAEDTVARLGGDEFVVVSQGLTDGAAAVALAERMERALAEPVAIDGARVMLTASIGVAVTDSPSADPERLVQDADAAMYRVKQRSQGRFEVVDERMRSSALIEEALIDDIGRAVAAGEFIPYYQPIVDLSSSEVMGVEVLARWRHPTRGVLAPEAFLDVAEESGLIVGIGNSLLWQATEDLGRLRAVLGDRVRLFVNLSGRQLQQLDLASSITAALDAASIDSSALVLELHESISSTAIAEAAELGRLVDRGVDVWLDDVGAGTRSVLHDAPVPVRGLKIDRQFVCGDVDEAAVVGVLAIAGARGQQVVAEGVETADDEATLRRLGVRYAQGYHLAMPTTADDLVEYGVRAAVILT